MPTYNCLVINGTDERLTPDIHGAKTNVRLNPGEEWETVMLELTRPGVEEWIGTPNGNWTAAKYPVNNDANNIKEYVRYNEVGTTPPTTEVVTIRTFSDGSVTVNDQPFPI